MDNQSVIDALNADLANLVVVNTKLHNYHWNIQGPAFFGLHEQTEAWYNYVFQFSDDVAERVLQLGSKPLSTLKDYLAKATIAEDPAQTFTPKDLLDKVEVDFKALRESASKVRAQAEEAGDIGTVAMYDGQIGWLEKALWMIQQSKPCNQ